MASPHLGSEWQPVAKGGNLDFGPEDGTGNSGIPVELMWGR